MLGEEVRWISARGQGADAGVIDGVMFGIFLDVTNRKQSEEGHELLAGEMSHRVKNLLAIATSLTHISLRSATSIEEMAQDLIQRLTALGRAHDLVRPLPGNQGKAALLGYLLSILLAPYDDPGAFAGRIRVAVPRMGIGEEQRRPLPWWSTSLPPIRSSMRHCRSSKGLSMFQDRPMRPTLMCSCPGTAWQIAAPFSWWPPIHLLGAYLVGRLTPAAC